MVWILINQLLFSLRKLNRSKSKTLGAFLLGSKISCFLSEKFPISISGRQVFQEHDNFFNVPLFKLCIMQKVLMENFLSSLVPFNLL